MPTYEIVRSISGKITVSDPITEGIDYLIQTTDHFVSLNIHFERGTNGRKAVIRPHGFNYDHEKIKSPNFVIFTAAGSVFVDTREAEKIDILSEVRGGVRVNLGDGQKVILFENIVSVGQEEHQLLWSSKPPDLSNLQPLFSHRPGTFAPLKLNFEEFNRPRKHYRSRKKRSS